MQVSAPKSGSYWLHTILKQVLKKKGIKQKSFIKEQEIYRELKDREFSFKDQPGVDMIDIEEEGLFYRVGAVFREKIEEPEKYINSTTLAWTHSTLCSRSFEIFPLFNKKVCIVRDPRDRALSSAKFAFTPYMQKQYPTSYSSPREYLEGEYEKLIKQWVWFVGNYLQHKEELNIHFVFYESLLNDFAAEFDRLLNYLELPLPNVDKIEIAEAVDFSSMKDKSPKHLHKGRSRKWVNNLDEQKKRITLKIAGNLLEYLNYPMKEEDEHLPFVPLEGLGPEIKNELQEMDWQGLFQKV